MKICPTCKETYKDDELNFCLADGTTLLAKKNGKVTKHSRLNEVIAVALIGLALVIFYTLLVAISEHTSFNSAYFISALMTIGLTGLYTRALFDSGRMALLVSGTLTLLYGFLFVVLQQQDYALLIGSLGLFVILGTVMYFSRRIDW